MATEKRMISYGDAVRFLRDSKVPETGAFSKGINKGLNIALSALGNNEILPYVDAVEVVRCKDCKHCERDHTLDAGGDEYYYCWHIVMEHGQARPNEFCCYGERKDNGKSESAE